MSGTLIVDIETYGAAAHDERTQAAVAEMAAERDDQDPGAFAALSPALARVVCVGFRNVDSGHDRAYFDGELLGVADGPAPWAKEHVAYGGERALLAAVNDVLSRAGCIVTFNGRAFDVPVLVHRSIANGVRPAAFLMMAARESRYPNWKGTPRLHVDLREQFTFFGAVWGPGGTLRAYALGYGLEDPKANGSGADVAQLVERKDARALATYCLGDVGITAELFKRWTALVAVA